MFGKLLRKLTQGRRFDEESALIETAAPVEDALAEALHLLNSGRIAEAESAYQVIFGSPKDRHVAALQLGIIAHLRGDDRGAFDLIEQSVHLNPEYAQAHNHLGNALRGEQRVVEALASYRKAIELEPEYAAPHYNIGSVLLQLGDTEAALSCFETALSLNASFADAYNSLGMAQMDLGEPEKAVESYRQALQLNPDFFEALNNIAIALMNLKRAEEALAACQRALSLRPDSAELDNTNGLVFIELGRFEQAMACFRRAIDLKPEFAAPHNNIGIVLKKVGRYQEAIEHYQKAIGLNPKYFEAICNLSFVQCKLGELTQAIASCTLVLELRPDYQDAHYSMGLALVAQGRLPEALAEFERAGARDNALSHSNLLFTMNYTQGFSQKDIYLESRRWDEAHCEQARARRRSHKNGRDSERRLKVGFVSPDFRKHSVSFFFRPVLEQAFRLTGMECACYADVPNPDTTTKRLREFAGQWVDAVGLSDEALAQRVRDDGIDILFDLAGHTGLRLSMFAEKPAPVQASWLGYPNSTGLRDIDYRLTDAIADPEGEADLFHSERLYHMPNGFLCYSPHEDAPNVNTLPALANGFVTFGSFNNLAKVTPEVIGLWALVLKLVPGSRLIIKWNSFSDLPTRLLCESAFACKGIDPSRLELRPSDESAESHLSVYGRIDIALDTFPYNGTTTTCESLWMGVPVVTLLGDRHAARVGASILSRLGLQTLIAKDDEEYLSIACGLAADLERLSSLRGTLRGTMAGSPLCDARSFAESMESACREMWRRWCSEADAPR